MATQSQAGEINITLGLSTPLGSQDVSKSNGEYWESGDPIGSLIVSTSCGYVDCNLWHHSIINDSKDVGVTGFGISKNWKFNW